MTSETTVGELARIDSGYAFKSSEWLPSGIPVVKIRNIKDGIVTLDDCAFVSESSAQRASDFRAESGDILISLTGYVGQVGRVRLNEAVYVNQRVGFVRPKNPIDSDYIYYLLRYLRVQIEELGTGTAQANVAPKDIMKLSIPSLSTESRLVVGNFLRKLDEKIEVNNAASRTLEDIAQTIFKSWFIDFDPVRAKMVGEKPASMDDETAALFPDSMEESELGLIPKGWKVSNLDSLSTVKFGAPFASKFFNTTKAGIPLIRIRDLKKQSISTWSPENHAKGFLVTGGELLVGMDGEFNPTIWFGEDANVNQRICKIEPKSFVSNFYLYFTLLPIMRRIEHGSTGSTVIHLGKTDIDAIKVTEPSKEILAAYKSMVEPMLRQMVSLNVQARILQHIRDALLPRLISGELQIANEMLAS
jgi:type I restriction enzyme S subunit